MIPMPLGFLRSIIQAFIPMPIASESFDNYPDNTVIVGQPFGPNGDIWSSTYSTQVKILPKVVGGKVIMPMSIITGSGTSNSGISIPNIGKDITVKADLTFIKPLPTTYTASIEIALRWPTGTNTTSYCRLVFMSSQILLRGVDYSNIVLSVPLNVPHHIELMVSGMTAKLVTPFGDMTLLGIIDTPDANSGICIYGANWSYDTPCTDFIHLDNLEIVTAPSKAVYLYETFTGADATLVVGKSLNIGGVWEHFSGNSVSLALLTGAANAPAATNQIVMCSTDLPKNNFRMQAASFYRNSTTTSIYFRCDGNPIAPNMIEVRLVKPTISLYIWENGVPRLISSGTMVYNMHGSILHYCVEVIGTHAKAVLLVQGYRAVAEGDIGEAKGSKIGFGGISPPTLPWYMDYIKIEEI